MNVQGHKYTSPEEFAEEQERLSRRRNYAIAQQMMRDARPMHVTGKGMLKLFGKILLGCGFVVLLLEAGLIFVWIGQVLDWISGL
jgi:hypothetical protein